MLAVRCPQVATARGERLVGERHITGMAVLDGRRLLTVACPCGSEHVLDLGRHGSGARRVAQQAARTPP